MPIGPRYFVVTFLYRNCTLYVDMKTFSRLDTYIYMDIIFSTHINFNSKKEEVIGPRELFHVV